MAQTTPFEYDVEVLPKAKLGIDPRVIEMMLDEARGEWRKLESQYQQQIAQLNEKIEVLESERSTIQTVLISAQKNAEQTLRLAQEEAESARREALEKVQREEAERSSQLKSLQDEVAKYTQMKQAVTQDIRAMLEGYLRDLDSHLAMKMASTESSLTHTQEVPAVFARPVTNGSASHESDMIAAHGFGEGS